MKRLHQIVDGTNHGPFGPRDQGYRWQLDCGNDWFAEVNREKERCLILACRYSSAEAELRTFGDFVQEHFHGNEQPLPDWKQKEIGDKTDPKPAPVVIINQTNHFS